MRLSAAVAAVRAHAFCEPGYDDGTPAPERSALTTWLNRKPPPPPGIVAVNPSTDAKAVLARFLAEPIAGEKPVAPGDRLLQRRRSAASPTMRAKLKAAAASAAARDTRTRLRIACV
jgi:hypothetical protein